MSRTSSRTGIALTALALAVAPLSPLAADQRPDRIALATGRLPEGIAAGPGTTFFVGARSDGDVYVGDVRRDTVTGLVDEPTPARPRSACTCTTTTAPVGCGSRAAARAPAAASGRSRPTTAGARSSLSSSRSRQGATPRDRRHGCP